MSGRSRVFRRRVSDGDGAEDAGAVAASPASLVASRKAKEKEKKAGKRSSLLSFDEEESTSPQQAKTESRLKPKAKDRPRPDLKGLRLADDANGSTQRSAAGEYSAERMQELRANAKSFTGPRAPMSSVQGAADDGGSFKLSGSFKPAAPKQEPETHRTVTKLERAELPPPSGPKPAYVSVASQQAPAGAHPAEPQVADEDEEDDFHVPSAEMIRLAKQKRERLRSAHLAPDYVPLGGAAGLASLEARLKPEGRLLGSEAAAPLSDGSDEEGRGQRTAFVGGNGAHGTLAGVFPEAKEEPQPARADQDDDDDWVREQIRKGVGGSARPRPPGTLAGNSSSAASSAPLAGTRAASESVAAAGEAALGALQHSVQRLRQTQANIGAQAGKTQDNMQGSIQSVARLQAELAAAGDKYTFLQQLRSYIADLCDMLQAKAAVVEELEEHLLAAGEQRAAAAAQRSAGDDAAEAEAAGAAVSAALGVLSRGGELDAEQDCAAARAAASSATRQAEDRLAGAAGPVELDEFGRDVGRGASLEMAHRAARLESRSSKWLADPDGAGGAETSDESESEVAQHGRRRREVLETAASVFADAGDEFRTLPAVRGRLEAWRAGSPEAYAAAYAADSAPAIFAPFVRSELLAWDPIFQRTRDFDEQSWYRALLDYGHSRSSMDNHADGRGSDDAQDLIPALVSNLVVPLARHNVQACWNPFSRQQTKWVVRMLDHMLVFLSVEDAKIQELFAEVRQKLEAAVSLVRLPPWPQAATAAAPNAARLLAHRFGKALRLVQSIAAFDSLLPRPPLQAMVFERLIQQQLLTYATGSPSSLDAAVTRCERLSSAIPKAWARPAAADPFADALVRLARSLEGRRGASPTDARLAARLAAQLVRWQEASAAERLKAAYGL